MNPPAGPGRSCWLAAVTLACVLSLPGSAGSTVMEALALPRILQTSQLTFVGTVLDATSGWERGWIVTRSRVLVETVVDSRLQRTPMIVEVMTLGGEVPGRGLWVPGEAQLVVGSRYLLFTAEEGDHFRPVGMGQTALQVFGSEGDPLVMPPLAHGLVVSDGPQLRPALPFLTRPVSLVEMIARIRRAQETGGC